MKTFLEFMSYCIPIVFIVLSRMYLIRLNNLQGTGKIPDIIDAIRLKNLFLALSVLSGMVIFIIKFF